MNDQSSWQLELHVYFDNKFNLTNFQDVKWVEFGENKLSKLVHSLVSLAFWTKEMKLERMKETNEMELETMVEENIKGRKE